MRSASSLRLPLAPIQEHVVSNHPAPHYPAASSGRLIMSEVPRSPHLSLLHEHMVSCVALCTCCLLHTVTPSALYPLQAATNEDTAGSSSREGYLGNEPQDSAPASTGGREVRCGRAAEASAPRLAHHNMNDQVLLLLLQAPLASVAREIAGFEAGCVAPSELSHRLLSLLLAERAERERERAAHERLRKAERDKRWAERLLLIALFCGAGVFMRPRPHRERQGHREERPAKEKRNWWA